MRVMSALFLGANTLALSGCVAAAFIPVAGGALLRNKIEKRDEAAPDLSQASNVPEVSAEPQGAAIMQGQSEFEQLSALPIPSLGPSPEPSPETSPDIDPSDESPNNGLARGSLDGFEEALSAGGYSVLNALPEPGAPIAASRAASPTPNGQNAHLVWRDFADYALSHAPKGPSSEGRETEGGAPRDRLMDPPETYSALMVDPGSLAPAMITCQDKPAAVLIDLDPATGPLPLGEAGNPAREMPETRKMPTIANALTSLRDEGIAIFWISDHGAGDAGKIRKFLRETMLDSLGADPLLVMRYPGEKKQGRRRRVGQTHCLIAIAGDAHEDFDELYEFLRTPSSASDLESLLGNGWFLTPPFAR